MLDRQEARLGQQVGEYRLVRKLGDGGFGTVYLAEHVHEHTKVAVKVLNMRLTKSEDFKDFLNEARTMRLRHPHIAPLLDFGMSRDDLPFLVMEYAPEGTLRDRHPKGDRLALSTIVSYVDQLTQALQYAHDHHVIHRDVKPENILVRADGTLLVSDFGVAKLLEQSELVSRQTQVGTPVYMAPEQYRGYPCFASDQYALAVMTYEWICGVRPFQGPAIGLAIQHMNTPPLPLRDHLPHLSKTVERVILKALAKTPEERFEHIQQFADALHEAVQPPASTIVPSQSIETSITVPLMTPEPQRQTAMAASPSSWPKSSPHPKPRSRRWSRRMVLLAGTVSSVGGGMIWLAFAQGMLTKYIPSLLSNSQPNQPPPVFKGHLDKGSFSTLDIRPPDKPQLKNSALIAFTHPFSAPPALPLGLMAMDIDRKANIRISAYTNNVTKDNFQINIDSWYDTVLYSGGCAWLEIAPNNNDFQWGQFNTEEDHPWDHPQMNTTKRITFPRVYTGLPRVVVWLNQLNMSNSANWRVNVYATDISQTGFTLHIDTWEDSILYSAGVTWIAYSADNLDIASGTFGTSDIRPWDHPQPSNSKAISFSHSFGTAPRVTVALSSIDIGHRTNLRISATTSSVTPTGMTWHLDSWSDTILYAARGTYIAQV
jgi:serine/threonine protein kinase